MTLAVVSSYTGECLPVLLTSLRCYAPHWKVVVASKQPPAGFDVRHVPHFGQNYGEAFQYAVGKAVEIYPDEERIVILNDDCVLRPDTAKLLEEDFDLVERQGVKVGLVVTRCDIVCGPQNVRMAHDGRTDFHGPRLVGEMDVVQIKSAIPVCGMFLKSVWRKYPIPPIGWSADDVWSYDMMQDGYEHFMSSAYVHHVGGETMIEPLAKPSRAHSLRWIQEHRPRYYAEGNWE